MGPVSIVTGIATGLNLLKGAKELFMRDNALKDAEAIARKRMADDVGTLQEQLKAHREVIDKLLEQARAGQEMMEKQNLVLTQLGEATQTVAEEMAKMRTLALVAIGVSILSLAGLVIVLLR